jgi:carbon-monoxide dehydrogenase large subunit
MLWMAIVRSPYAHARITKVDLSKALAADGVVAAFSGADLADEWAGSLPCAWPVTGDCHIPQHRPLSSDKARYAGDGVAVVVAESRALAKDGAELVEVDYEPLPAVTDVGEAVTDSAPLVHDEYEGNRAYTWPLQTGEIDKLFSEAAVTVKEHYRQQRLIPNAMETRSVLVQPVLATDEYTMWSATQVPHIARVTLSGTTGIPETKLRVIAPDVGGGFGSKLNVYAEEALCLVLARRLGLPIKWTEERSENYVATIHGRDVLQEIELAATEEGKVTAVRVRLTAAMGAYMQLVSPGIPLLGAWLYAGCYDVQAYDFECVGVFTNTTPTDAYRGAGRPEATYAIERAMDTLARELDIDPVELRRKNFIPTESFPNYTIASGLTVDSADYHGTLDKCLEVLDYDAVRAEQRTRRDRGDRKLLGVGFSTWIEMCGLAPSRVLSALNYAAGGWDAATIELMPTGTVRVLTGVSPHGQGSATVFAQVVADQLGVDYDDVEVLHGDTATTPFGMDTYGSRGVSVGGVALHAAGEKLIAKARTLAAHELECAEDDLEFAGGNFTVKGTDRSVGIKALAFSSWTAHNLPDGMEPGLQATHLYDPPNFSWPNGAHCCVVEVDQDTGSVDIVRYLAVDDCGVQLNPMLVEGQVHGGVAQGIAEALFEEAIYDDEGNLATGTMTNYLVPGPPELPSFEVHDTVTPSPTNPMGVKGIGEAGTIAAPPAVINAIVDALAHLGVRDVERPATPERVWRAIQEAKEGRS